ncbi:uncharacterized protein LOC106090430 [Stomoxys calcitrans]|uniref:LITAF domain-containing protein n=1 Tax=Stomoxys calcitrans TaxID=35570 RepID=A0A1I8PYK3_STOCA|nr:uncharacterized protein LOC106090430 [Stomoxys calcitrans]
MDHPQQMDTVAKQNRIKLKLIPAKSSDVSNGQVIASLVVVNDEGEANGGAGDGSNALPYIDEAVTATNVNQLQSVRDVKEEKPRVRFYAVGPSTYKVKCPLCHQNANACVMRGASCKDATCCLSLLSCVFPIFWLCCLCTWCGCNSEWHTNSLYCSQCGGKLGKLRKPL